MFIERTNAEVKHFTSMKHFFDHLTQRADSLEKTLMLGKIEGRRRMGRQRMRWLNNITKSMDMLLLLSLSSRVRLCVTP